MAAKEKKATRKMPSADSRAAVDLFMARLEHPSKDQIQAIREIICGVDRSIAEGVKWKAPSFRTTEYFATTHLRAKDGVGVILHLGAKVRANPSVLVDDPDGMLKWLGKDRAMVSFTGIVNSGSSMCRRHRSLKIQGARGGLTTPTSRAS